MLQIPSEMHEGFNSQESIQTIQKTKKYDKPHMIIPDEDMAWALNARSPVYKLWGECWRSDPYGSRWMLLHTSLGKENLKKAKKPLIDAGLFLFENRLTIVDGKRCYEWWVKNLHGSRSIYWKLKDIEISATSENNTLNLFDTATDGDLNNTDLKADYGDGTQYTEVGTHNTTQSQESTYHTDVGADNTDARTDNPNVGANNTDVGTYNTTQPYLKSLSAKVLEALSNASLTSHKHFINSLRIGEGEKFLDFCLKKINALTAKGFEVHTHDGWIAKHYDQYWEEFSNEKVQNTGGINSPTHCGGANSTKVQNFESWGASTHEGQYHTLMNLGLAKFCENPTSKAWYEWARAKHPERFIEVPE
jgi:hypothetical protein